jgi:hypothetical protein
MDEAVGVGLAPRTDEHLGRRGRRRGGGYIVFGCIFLQVGRCEWKEGAVSDRQRERERGRGLTVFSARGAGRVVEDAHVSDVFASYTCWSKLAQSPFLRRENRVQVGARRDTEKPRACLSARGYCRRTGPTSARVRSRAIDALELDPSVGLERSGV